MATKLKQMRLSKNMSQTELAKAVGVSQQSVSLWENGIREPKLKTIKKLCEIFECGIADLI